MAVDSFDDAVNQEPSMLIDDCAICIISLHPDVASIHQKRTRRTKPLKLQANSIKAASNAMSESV